MKKNGDSKVGKYLVSGRTKRRKKRKKIFGGGKCFISEGGKYFFIFQISIDKRIREYPVILANIESVWIQ